MHEHAVKRIHLVCGLVMPKRVISEYFRRPVASFGHPAAQQLPGRTHPIQDVLKVMEFGLDYIGIELPI